ncbi:fumarylacetoacetate hydrolase family protein [Alicyclobacillus vulcanalis]|uniref:5-oxopent-3-ene-1,2,5-tricarboxylate decarboxylase / 2-hydroxyhepta-2,4-diene-1,7-dioate isomerase n=1 Tax=Alicyclobacillus vulcanalis TaxID=252246 RepID=A0A1N7P3X5_9BACL|nr:fumarylacetoacetate hydrolase family protein [Alicyclobacillus vulcanalis]SIT05139.1 5-oxopent-3-ene-1,2,5-tricarboxylate decarboxylase / 2-hydroxyhepta-2,4-diene-1,7-dioate isomerase [Alicyclobacillus vulcanalis]
MRHARYIYQGRMHEGVLRDGELHDEQGRRVPMEEVVWLPPISPRTVYGLALNFADHAAELHLEKPKEPVLFIKPNASLIGHLAPICYPAGVEYMHYEAELAVIIGRAGRRIRREDAFHHVLGYTIANDVTVRDFVGNMYRPPIRAKGWDTFGPLGPWWVDAADISNPHQLAIRTYVNGDVRQQGNTQDMIFRIDDIIAFLSSFTTLYPGDVILTGTPPGISPVRPGDVIEVEIEGIGRLQNPVVEEGASS